MPDIELYCGHCQEKTGFTHIHGTLCVCSVCGEERHPAGIGKLMKAKLASKTRTTSEQPETNPAPAEPIAAQTETEPAALETREPKGETTMAYKRLSDQEKADIIRRHEASEATSVLAADFHVSEQCIRNTFNAAGVPKKEKKVKPAKKGKSPRATRPAQATEPQGDQAGTFKASLQALVDAAVDAKLADLGYVKADELDAKIEAARARLLK